MVDYNNNMIFNIYHWFDANLLALNVKKNVSSYILSHMQQTELQTSKGSISHPADQFVQFLGVLLDENLTFKWHIMSIRLKVSQGLGIIWKLK